MVVMQYLACMPALLTKHLGIHELRTRLEPWGDVCRDPDSDRWPADHLEFRQLLDTSHNDLI
jgi:hypothetical protein